MNLEFKTELLALY